MYDSTCGGKLLPRQGTKLTFDMGLSTSETMQRLRQVIVVTAFLSY